MRGSLDRRWGCSFASRLVTTCIALIVCAGASAALLPTAQQIVRDMDGAKFTYVRSQNGYPGWKTVFSAGSAFAPRITDVLSDMKQGFAKITLAVDYVDDGFVSHNAIFKVNYRLYDQGWRLDGDITGTSDEYEWVVLNQSASNGAIGSGPSTQGKLADIAAIEHAVAERLTMSSAIKAEIADSMYEKGQPPGSCSWQGSSARRITCPEYMSIGESGQIRIDLESIGVPALKGSYIYLRPSWVGGDVVWTFCYNGPAAYRPNSSWKACGPGEGGSR